MDKLSGGAKEARAGRDDADSAVDQERDGQRLARGHDGRAANICEALKKQTQAQHLRWEQRLNLAARVLSLRDYRERLSKFYGIYALLSRCYGAHCKRWRRSSS